MLTKEMLMESKDDLQRLTGEIGNTDLDLLVGWLKEKDDNLRYAAFLLLQMLSASDDRVYRYWENFTVMIRDTNSYQRSLGLMLIAENVRWDSNDYFGKIYDFYLEHCDDEKFITSRQCIQGLLKIIGYTPKYRQEIVDALLGIDLDSKKESQRGLLLMDIAEILGILYKEQNVDKGLQTRIESYLKARSVTGNDKIKKKIKGILN